MRRERSTDGHVSVDGEQNGEPDDATLGDVAERVKVSNDVGMRPLESFRFGHRHQTEEDGENDEGETEDKVVGDGEGLEEEDWYPVASILLEDEDRDRVSGDTEHAQKTDDYEVQDELETGTLQKVRR